MYTTPLYRKSIGGVTVMPLLLHTAAERQTDEDESAALSLTHWLTHSLTFPYFLKYIIKSTSWPEPLNNQKKKRRTRNNPPPPFPGYIAINTQVEMMNDEWYLQNKREARYAINSRSRNMFETITGCCESLFIIILHLGNN